MKKSFLQELPKGLGMRVISENPTSFISGEEPRGNVIRAFFEPIENHPRHFKIYCKTCTTIILDSKDMAIHAVSELFLKKMIDESEFNELQILLDSLKKLEPINNGF